LGRAIFVGESDGRLLIGGIEKGDGQGVLPGAKAVRLSLV